MGFFKIEIFTVVLFCVFITEAFAQDNIDYSRAERLFIEQCSKCHRKDGRGIKLVYPPVKNSDYIQKMDNIELIRGMLFGRSGKIVVNGTTYNGVMVTEIDKSLTDDDIILILTHVLHKLNNLNKPVTLKEVKEARKLGKLPVHK